MRCRWGRLVPRICRRRWIALVCLAALIAAGRRAWAQSRYLDPYVEPEWLTMHLSGVSAGAYAEGMFDQSDYKNSRTSVSHEHLFAGPSFGFNLDGSIYHPNLLRYFISTDGAVGWGEDKFDSNTSVRRSELQYLGRFSATAELLEGKPYHLGLFSSYDHTFRDNDFFSRVTVDSWRYGARAGWEVGKLSLNLDYYHRDETSSSPYPITIVTTPAGGGIQQTNQVQADATSQTHEDTLTLTARTERDHGGSRLGYNLSTYTRTDAARVGTGTDQSVSLGDGERFGAHDQYRINSSASFTHRESDVEQSDEVLGNANASLEHSEHLNSYYDLNYDRFTTAGFESDSYAGSAVLQHQLYDSLSSALVFRGGDNENTADGSSGYVRRFGGGLAEHYTKKLSEETRLRLGNTVFLDHTDQQTVGNVQNEPHSFLPAGENGAPPNSFFLSQPNVVLSSIVVTDTQHTQPAFLEGFDYRLYNLGSQTVIERLVGSAMPANVLVAYRTEPTPPGSYESLSEGCEIRIEFWRNLWGLYGRLNLSENNAPSDLHIQQFESYVLGTDLSWRWARAGAEYEIYNSTESDYRAWRLFQSVAFRLDEVSSVSVDLNETWLEFTTANRREEDLRFITRFHRALTERLGLDVDAGTAWRRGTGVDQVLATFRPSLKYAIGKTTIDVGYDYEYELYLNSEERQKHLFTVRMKRLF